MNNTIKDILVKTVFRVASIINILISKRDNIVLFYSNVGFRDNIRSVYDYMIKENYNSKYRIYISANSFLPDIVPENVTIISNIKGVMKIFKNMRGKSRSTVDFLAVNVNRAPKWMSEHGLNGFIDYSKSQRNY